MYDVAIIGGGVVGCAIARELSKYELKTIVIEAKEDISTGATKANSGIVHGGYDADHKKLKGYFSRKGNQMFDKLEEELNFGFKRCGSLVLAFSEEERSHLEKIIENGVKNGVDDLVIIEKEEILQLEPHVSKDVMYALHCPSAGITSPYEFAIALMENAIANGSELILNNPVTSIEDLGNNFIIKGERKDIKSKVVINCAGVHSDEVAKMVGIDDFYIIPRKGEYLLFQRGTGEMAKKVLFQCPSKKGKGVLVTSTYHNNLMIGPNAQEVAVKEDLSTSKETLDHIVNTARKTLPDFDIKKVIRSFAGIRSTSSTGDFIVGRTNVNGFYNCAGIESPGLTSSPAIAVHIAKLIEEDLNPNKNEKFNPYREKVAIKLTDNNTLDMKDVLPLTQLPFGDSDRIVCRCEQVREKTIRECLRRGIKVDSTDGVKRRSRAGMGICQGNFCTSRVKEIIADEYNISLDEVTERGTMSSDLSDRIKRSDFFK